MRRIIVVGIILLVLIATPLIALFLINQKTATQTHASPSSSLLFESVNSPIIVGQPFSIVLDVNPVSGGVSNAVSYVKVDISYDGSKLQATSNSFVPSSVFSTVIAAPTNICNGNACTLSTSLSVGPDPTKAVTSQTPVGTITFTPLAPTTQNAPLALGFVTGQNQILSIPTQNQPAQNVFTQGIPASLAILPATNISLTTPTTTSSPASNTLQSGNSSLLAAPTTSGQLPVCTNLTVTQVATDASGLTYQLVATGVDSYGTISSVTFSFGDGSSQIVSSGPTLGTNSVNASAMHAYQTSGTYTVSSVMTDSNKQTSTPASCSQSLTVGALAQGNGSQDSSTSSGNLSPSQPAPTTTLTSLPITGPVNLIPLGMLGVGLVFLGVLFVLGV